jgi:pimeloyl-ACP methyl ester carboxylesterase
MRKRNFAMAVAGALGGAVAVKMLTRPASVEWDDVSKSVPHSENSNFVEIDGSTVHYQEFGDAADPAVILIHGFTSSVYVWKAAAPLIADRGFRVLAIDMLGFGYSDKPAWFDYSIGSQARVIARFMDRLGVGRAAVIGSSYGGAVAATLALDYPERVERLVLVASVINDAPKDHPLLKLAAIPGIGEIITPFLVDSRVFARFRMHSTLAKPNHYLITEERVSSVLRPLTAADAHRSVLATSRNWHANRIERDVHLLDQPTLIVWGEDDTVVPIADGYTLHRSISVSRFVVLRNCGHLAQEERPEIFVDLVCGFLETPRQIEGVKST